jgi:hypothetical protein
VRFLKHEEAIIERERLMRHRTYKHKAYIGSVLLKWVLNFDSIRNMVERAEARQEKVEPEEWDQLTKFHYFGNVSSISQFKWHSCWAISFSEETVLFRISKQKLDALLFQCQTTDNTNLVIKSFESLNVNENIAKKLCYSFQERTITAGSLLINA